MSKQQGLTPAELEVTQKMQTHFPRELNAEVLGFANSCPIQDITNAIAEMLDRLANGTKTATPKLLKLITSIQTSTIERFIATDCFKAGETVDGVKIGWLNNSFRRLFLPKVETGIQSVKIKVHQLLRNSKDLGIRAEISETHEEIKLAHFWLVLKAHNDKKVGNWIIAYIIGTDGNLWAVHANWCGGGWDLYASSVEYPRPWSADYQVCSR